MDCIMIKCPHCRESYLTILKDGKGECPVCKKEVVITIQPGKVHVKKGG